MVNYPVKPALVEPVMQELFALSLPEDVHLETPTFNGVMPPSPGPFHPAVSFLYLAYGNTIQDVIDSKIVQMAGYVVPGGFDNDEWRRIKLETALKAHQERTALLEEAAGKNSDGMAGHVVKALQELSMKERMDLANAALKLVMDDATFSQEQISLAMKAAIESDAMRFDSHHHLQVANFEIADAVAKENQEAFSTELEAYRERLKTLDTQIEQYKAEVKRELQELEKYALEIKAASLRIEHQVILVEAYKAGVDFLMEKARLKVIEFQVDIIKAEIERNKVLKYKAEIDKYAALINANTAQYELYRARAKAVLAELHKYKARVEVASAQLDVAETNVRTAREIAEALIDKANEELKAQHIRLDSARERLDAEIQQARALIMEYRAGLENAISGMVRSLGSIRAAAVLERATAQISARSNVQHIIDAQKLDSAQSEAESHMTAEHTISQASGQFRLDEATAAASAQVTSKLIHSLAGG